MPVLVHRDENELGAGDVDAILKAVPQHPDLDIQGQRGRPVRIRSV